MKLRLCLLSGGILCASLLLLTEGCRRHAPAAASSTPAAGKTATPEQPPPTLPTVFAAAESALAAGQTNAAIAGVEAAFTNRDFAADRPQILDALLRLLLRCNRMDEARQRALTASTDPTLSERACELIYSYYHASGDLPSAQAWAAQITAHPGVPPAVCRQALAWNLADAISLRNDEQALAILTQATRTLQDPADHLYLVGLAIEALLNGGRPERVEPVLALTATLNANPNNIKRLILATRVRVAAVSSNWPALSSSFAAAVNALPDDELNNLQQTIIPVATRAGQQALVDQCAEMIIRNATAPDKPAAVATATRTWVENTIATNKNAFPGQLMALLDAKVPASLVAEQFTRYFYAFSEQPVPIKELIVLAERLAPLLPDDASRNDIRIKVLDGCFLVQDYDRALTLLEARVPGANRTEQWHAAAIVKVRAHRALQRNEPREAVKYFREFMAQFRQSKETEVSDPVTGMSFPKEMVLGRNAKRIGDILAGIPDAAEAAKAYAEARNLYQQAIKNTSDAEAHKVVEEELAQLPKERDTGASRQ